MDSKDTTTLTPQLTELTAQEWLIWAIVEDIKRRIRRLNTTPLTEDETKAIEDRIKQKANDWLLHVATDEVVTSLACAATKELILTRQAARNTKD